MKLIIIRHGDPNYAIDSLTKKGKKEALLLSERIEKLNPDYIYCSPLGRAKKTAKIGTKRIDKKFTVLPWLREFDAKIHLDSGNAICWDRLPSEWTKIDELYTTNWVNAEKYKEGNVKNEYEKVCKELDNLLKKHGYEHDGRIFKAVKPNHDTIVFFCHFGVECVLLSHILSVSPMPFWHNFAALPTSVTTLVTEEREKGIASFRILSFGDLSHLYKGGEEPSFACRFCECYNDKTRH